MIALRLLVCKVSFVAVEVSSVRSGVLDIAVGMAGRGSVTERSAWDEDRDTGEGCLLREDRLCRCKGCSSASGFADVATDFWWPSAWLMRAKRLKALM